MPEYTQSRVDSMFKIGNAWVRSSRIESVAVDDKRWGVTASGKDLFMTTVTLFSGATFQHKVTDVEAFIKRIIG